MGLGGAADLLSRDGVPGIVFCGHSLLGRELHSLERQCVSPQIDLVQISLQRDDFDMTALFRQVARHQPTAIPLLPFAFLTMS